MTKKQTLALLMLLIAPADFTFAGGSGSALQASRVSSEQIQTLQDEITRIQQDLDAHKTQLETLRTERDGLLYKHFPELLATLALGHQYITRIRADRIRKIILEHEIAAPWVAFSVYYDFERMNRLKDLLSSLEAEYKSNHEKIEAIKAEVEPLIKARTSSDVWFAKGRELDQLKHRNRAIEWVMPVIEYGTPYSAEQIMNQVLEKIEKYKVQLTDYQRTHILEEVQKIASDPRNKHAFTWPDYMNTRNAANAIELEKIKARSRTNVIAMLALTGAVYGASKLSQKNLLDGTRPMTEDERAELLGAIEKESKVLEDKKQELEKLKGEL